VIQLIDVKKSFEGDGEVRWISNGVTFNLEKGKSLCIIGMSGEGKSVLLKQISGLIRPTSGSIFIDEINITSLTDDEMDIIFKKCGYVFQFAALLDSLNIYENIALPLVERNVNKESIDELVIDSLKKVNLTDEILIKYPSEISGGMRKRVGLARTLVLNPDIILYDEPTSGLDPVNTKIIHELMHSTQINYNITSIVISHDIEIFKYVDHVAFLYKGVIEYFGDAKNIWECENELVYKFIRGINIV